MEISKMDLARIALLKGLCETAESFLHRVAWAGENPKSDDSPKESLTEILRVIGTISDWFSPAFKIATQSQVMWGAVANLQNNHGSYENDFRWSECDLAIARNDIRILNELCESWLKTKETVTVCLKTKGMW